MATPPGGTVKIWCQTRHVFAPGDGITTPTGRRYEVLTARTQTRGIHAGVRQHLLLRVMFYDEPARERVTHITWRPR